MMTRRELGRPHVYNIDGSTATEPASLVEQLSHARPWEHASASQLGSAGEEPSMLSLILVNAREVGEVSMDEEASGEPWGLLL